MLGDMLDDERASRVTISMEDVVKGYQSVRRGHYEEPITMSVVDGGGVIVIHLGLILKTGKFPAELKSTSRFQPRFVLNSDSATS